MSLDTARSIPNLLQREEKLFYLLFIILVNWDSNDLGGAGFQWPFSHVAALVSPSSAHLVHTLLLLFLLNGMSSVSHVKLPKPDIGSVLSDLTLGSDLTRGLGVMIYKMGIINGAPFPGLL